MLLLLGLFESKNILLIMYNCRRINPNLVLFWIIKLQLLEMMD